MRILYICADHGIPIYGRRGCSTHVREACRGLVAAGHDVTLLASNTGGDSPVVEGLRVVCVEPPRSRRMGYDLRNCWHNCALYRAARDIADRAGIDAIYERLSLYGMTGMWMARRYHVPHVVEINAFLSQEHARKLHFRRFARGVERRVARQASSCIVVSDPLRQDLLAMGVEDRRITIMPTAVDTHLFRPDAQRRAQARARLGIADGCVVVGYVGGLAGWHGLATLHDTARALAQAGVDAVVLVVGGGDADDVARACAAAREAGVGAQIAPAFADAGKAAGSHTAADRPDATPTTSRAADSASGKPFTAEQSGGRPLTTEQTGGCGTILFTGGVPYTEVPALLDAMDVAVVPDTLPWTCPTKMFEYQASGLPTVAPRYPGVTQAMDDGHEGLLFDPHDWPAMTRAVLRLAGDASQRRALGAAARPRVEATHSWQRNVERVTEMLEGLKDEGERRKDE